MATGSTSITHLIINKPYEEPQQHWAYNHNDQTFFLEEGRRPAGYTVASGSGEDGGKFIELPVVNRIRPLVKAWREAGYPGVIEITHS